MTAQGFRLSPQQRRRWSLGEEARVAALSCRYAVSGGPEPDALRRGLERVVRRHHVLRTRFQATRGLAAPLQVIAEGAGIRWCDEEPEDAVGRPFDPSEEARVRAALSRRSDGATVLSLAVAAMCADARTLASMVREAFSDAGDGEGEVLQYVQYSEWKNEVAEETDAADDPEEVPAAPPLPLLGAGSGGDVGSRLHRLPWTGSGTLREALAARARSAGLEESALLLALWQTLLVRLTGREDLRVGVLSDDRRFEELSPILGPIEAWQEVTVLSRPELRLEEVARRSAEALSALPEVPPHLVARPGRGGPPARHAFGFEWREAEEPIPVAGGLCTLEQRSLPVEPAILCLTWGAAAGGPPAELLYDPGRYSAETAGRLLGHLDHLARGLLEDPRAPVGRASILPPAERSRLLAAGEGRVEGEAPGTVPERFLRQAAETPDAVSVVWHGGEWSYERLAREASVVAARVRAAGLRRGGRVVVCLDRGPELVAALCGVWLAGGAYVPVDPGDPWERLAWIVGDAGAQVVVTRGELAARIPAEGPRVVDLGDGAAPPPARETAAPLPDETAYVIYTSGSTGRPKGVEVSHGSLGWYVGAAAMAYGAVAGTVLHSSPAYDLTATSLWAPLAVGGRLRVIETEPGVEGLAEWLNRGEVYGFVKATPSHLQILSRLLHEGAGARVGRLVLGGEELLGERLALWRRESPGTEIVNEYGPTEVTVACSISASPAGELDDGPVAIGGPLPAARLHVLDSRGDLVPQGVAGELSVGGVGVARGYLGQPGQTAGSFVPDPFAATPGLRLYRTGDRVWWSGAGELVFGGRFDDQLKVRGHRIEPHEVEAALAACPGVREGAVALHEVAPGDARLVAYVVSEPGATLDVAELRTRLRRILPEPMVPSIVVPLDSLPLRRSGKVDRRALPAPGDHRARATTEYVAPRTPTEEALVAMWCGLLHLERVGVEDNFFDLGGHSLVATRLLAQVRERFGVDLQLAEFFRDPTVTTLAGDVDRALLEASEAADLEETLARIEALDEEEARSLLGTAPEGALEG